MHDMPILGRVAFAQSNRSNVAAMSYRELYAQRQEVVGELLADGE